MNGYGVFHVDGPNEEP